MEYTVVEITPTCLTLETEREKRPLRYPLRQPLPGGFKVGDRVRSEWHPDRFADHVPPKENSGHYDLTHVPSGLTVRIPHADYFQEDGERRNDF